MSPTLHPRLLAGVIAAGLAFGLVGCAQPSYDPDAAERMQGRVHSASVAAASGDHAAVLDSLATLEVELQDALARDQVTQARFDAVTAAIGLVRADVEAAIAAATPVPAPTPETPVTEAPATDPVSAEEQAKQQRDAEKAAKEAAKEAKKAQKGPKNAPGQEKGTKGKGQG